MHGTENKLNYYVYRVNETKRWYRRKWQVEWEYCAWAQRGYTKFGPLATMRIRIAFPLLDRVYVRIRILIRRNITNRRWYRGRYDLFGRPCKKVSW